MPNVCPHIAGRSACEGVAGKGSGSRGAKGSDKVSGEPGQPTRKVVGPQPACGWQVKVPGADRVSARADTQAGAIDRACDILTDLGGVELTIQNRQGVLGATTSCAVTRRAQHRIRGYRTDPQAKGRTASLDACGRSCAPGAAEAAPADQAAALAVSD